MQVDGSLALWTTMLGWHYYNVIWGLMVASGIAFLPIVGLLLDHLISVRQRGSLLSGDGDSAFSAIEVDLFVMVLVLLLAVRPTGGAAITPTTLFYIPKQTVHDATPPTARRLNATNTAYDNVIQSDNYNLSSGSIPMPPIWFVVQQISGGISHSLVRNIDINGSVYRAMRGIANRASITDPGLKMVASDFHSECYAKALSQFRGRDDGANEFVPAGQANPALLAGDQEGVDIGWLGAALFQTDYYPSIRVSHVVQGFDYDATVDTEFAPGSIPNAGAPLCQEYWIALRDDIYDVAVADGSVDVFDRSRPRLARTLRSIPPRGSVEFRNEFARTYLAGTELSLSRTAEQILNSRQADLNFAQKGIAIGIDILQTGSLAKMALSAELFVDAVINMLIYMQAYALMILYLSIPLIMVFGRYSLGAATSVAIMIFLLKFLPVLWALIAWMDNSGGLALWRDKSFFGTLTGDGIDALKARLLHSVAIGFLYAASGALFFAFMAISGIKSAHAIAAAGRGVTPLGSGVAATTGAQAGAAFTRRAASNTGSAAAYGASRVARKLRQ